MTKKDYEAIAAVFAGRPFTPHVAEVKVIVYDLADAFAMGNPNFDRAKFLDAALRRTPLTPLELSDWLTK